MKFEDLKKAYMEILKDPDAGKDKAVELLQDIEKDYQTLDSLAQKVVDSDDRIRKLQDTNQKLFLMTTGSPDEQEEEEVKELTFAEKMALKAEELKGEK